MAGYLRQGRRTEPFGTEGWSYPSARVAQAFAIDLRSGTSPSMISKANERVYITAPC